MEHAIVFSSKTGNTRLLAKTLWEVLPQESCAYYGAPDDYALLAERLYVGFWTDKGSCDILTENFLAGVKNREVFLFGTAGFGGSPAYFAQILDTVRQKVDKSCTVVGGYMCQGKIQTSVRDRYVKMKETAEHAAQAEALIENFDRALQHPDQADLDGLKAAVQACKN